MKESRPGEGERGLASGVGIGAPLSLPAPGTPPAAAAWTAAHAAREPGEGSAGRRPRAPRPAAGHLPAHPAMPPQGTRPPWAGSRGRAAPTRGCALQWCPRGDLGRHTRVPLSGQEAQRSTQEHVVATQRSALRHRGVLGAPPVEPACPASWHAQGPSSGLLRRFVSSARLVSLSVQRESTLRVKTGRRQSLGPCDSL